MPNRTQIEKAMKNAKGNESLHDFNWLKFYFSIVKKNLKMTDREQKHLIELVERNT